MWKNQNVLITGGSQGIGLAVAQLLAKRQARLFLVARRKELLEQAIHSLPATQHHGYFCADLSALEQIKNVVDAAKKHFQNPVDSLIHCAGYAHPDYFQNLSLEDFQAHLRLNYLSAVALTQSLLQDMLPRNRGTLAYVSSVAGIRGIFGYSAYSPSKAALIAFAQSLADELASTSITISVLCPPDTQTPGLERENRTKPYETKQLSKNAKTLQPHRVAQTLLHGIERKKFWILPSWEGKILQAFNGCFPELLHKILHRLIRRYQKQKQHLQKS